MKSLSLIALGLSINAFAGINSTYFDSVDVSAIHDQELANEKKGVAPRFAVPKSVSINASLGHWDQTATGFTWSHRITAPNAVSLNFGFSSFHLPVGAELNIYSADHSQFIRTFTAADNNINHELWTPVIMSDDVVMELTVPSEESINDVQLVLTQVGQGFRTFSETTQKSGSCNIDVACTDSKGWENEVNTVGVISTGGTTFCTGFMVNNTKNDKTPFFMTADHCRIKANNAATLVVYWNYQASACGGSRDGKKVDFQTGAQFLAGHAQSDFTLVKLLSAPKAEWKVKFAGWDASGKEGGPTTAIHHPNTDEKAISFDHDSNEISTYLGTTAPGDGTHVRVVDWDKGTTEPGSSGSPLFDKNHRVIGQLHGGYAACENEDSDYYGRLYKSWTGGGSASTRLKDHLDAGNTGKLVTDTI